MATNPEALFVGIDLDYMAFDTDAFFYDGVLPLLTQSFPNITTASFVNDMDVFRHNFGPANDYDFFEHIARIGLNADEVEALILDNIGGNHLLRPGVEDFLEIQERKNTDRHIVTLGEDRYQRVKIKCAPALAGLSIHTLLEPKAEFITRKFAGRQGYLIDDAEVNGLPVGIVHLQVVSRKTKRAIDGAFTDMHALLSDGPEELVKVAA